MAIQIVREKMTLDAVKKAAQETFGEMVKAVVDVERELMAVGGELHADAEAVLLADGSRQKDLWGINIYPEKPQAERLEFSALINIRPSQGNRSPQIQDVKLRELIRRVVSKLVGA